MIPLSSAIVSPPEGLAVLLLHAGRPGAEPGTTPNIKPIVMGRCYEYSTLVNPGVR